MTNGTSTRKTCPKCGIEHEKPGKFCSRTCANSRQWTDAQKKVFSIRQTEYMAREESEEHRAKRQMQVQMLRAAGIMGSRGAPPKENLEDYMTNPDDYYIIPLNDDDLNSEDGAIWETI